jgi:hypothetical protein
LRQHRKLLKCELQTLQGLLATPDEANLAIAAERIKALRQHCKCALRDHLGATSAMFRSMIFLDIFKFTVLIRAQFELIATASDVFSFLAEHAAQDDPSEKASDGSPVVPDLREDLDALLFSMNRLQI